MASRKLRHYFDTRKIIIMASNPLKNILAKLEQSGHLSQIAIELSELKIYY